MTPTPRQMGKTRYRRTEAQSGRASEACRAQPRVRQRARPRHDRFIAGPDRRAHHGGPAARWRAEGQRRSIGRHGRNVTGHADLQHRSPAPYVCRTVGRGALSRLPQDAPPRLRRESGRRCPSETDFYAIVESATPPGILPRCYEAFTAADGAWRLLLEDLTATHEALGDWPIPSTVEQSDRIIDAHARFHAHWWDDARLGESVGAFLDTSGALNRHLTSFAKDFSTFVDRLGDRLSPEHKALYERLLAAAPRLLARYSSHRNLTIVHGDAHVWNVMMPRDPGQVDFRLIDWDGWRVDQATDDLAYMIALFWPAERRRRPERRALERYHATLLAHGVGGYGFDALWQDYRYSVLWQCATPVWQSVPGSGGPTWSASWSRSTSSASAT